MMINNCLQSTDIFSNKQVDVLLGLQWGDEGKGKIVDVLTPDYKIIARFQGGPNAGHSLEFSGQKYVLHTIPSGIFREGIINVIGNGVVIDPIIFKAEIEKLLESGVKVKDKLKISKKAHLILPSHRILDAALEAYKGQEKIGSTLKGIGPAYMDKIGRNGLRVGDIISDDFLEKYKIITEKHKNLLKQYDFEYDFDKFEVGFFEGIDNLKKYDLIESEYFLNNAISSGERILAEGAQGTLLDVDFGSYPFVTSSNTITAGALVGLGIAPNRIGEVFGIFKAYCTRVGSGPFPTELSDEIGENLRQIGKEFGSTTGRARRCGWLDLVALKYSVMINGVTKLIMTKADVMNDFKIIRVAVNYSIDGEITNIFPYKLSGDVVPVYKEFKGWEADITKFQSEEEFPIELKNYISYIENYLEVPICIVSVGPDREATIIRK